MRIAIGSDHGGLDLKITLMAVLDELGLSYQDMGTHEHTSCDYPDYAQRVAEGVASGAYDQGILVCGTGIGMSIAANKVQGIRAALCNDIFSAHMARNHNDANVLCLGARVVGPGVAQEIVRAYFTSTFEGGRHATRVAKIDRMEARK
jgi:ribose 5-phosphate isomerase B